MPITPTITASIRIADFMETYSWEALPTRIQDESQRALLNYLACTIRGAITPSADAAVRGIKSLDTAADTPIAGRTEHCGLSNAALLGALNASAHTFDDTHLATITHPTAPVASACLATAHRLSRTKRPVTGTRLLAAIAAGIELQCRISNAIRSDGTADMGWYITGLSGGIGTAIAVGHLLGLDHESMVSAVGLAATQACGLRATHGSMAIAFVPAVASRNGVDAAFLAEAGLTCSPIAIDGRNGLLQVLSSGADSTMITEGLGSRFELLNNAYKPYPCGIVIHPSIDGCLQIVNEHPIVPEEIDRIAVDVHPDAMTLTWRRLPETELDAQVSLFHWIAAVTVFRAAGIPEGSLRAIEDTRVRDLQNRIDVNIDLTLGDNQARVSMIMKDGRRFSTEVENATGSISNPMTTDQLIEKFRTLADPVLGTARQHETLRLWTDLPQASDAANLLTSTALA
ncbi:MmgE/PrpD family protein [Candidimonas sp. SYP-B2681]|uniref:MmgE/PrpD family protein n=1 Tax=Candidimonas sp. SYP-B2681 TaxID=2497686 RepID=UPI000F875ADF|nr:MmgE/PrpD family protein [Candidimonas sp. SYP-B2681]RTZ41550.1 MmgE/PrpD family protein [Candidimonas sp. SYP-B2681]